MFIYLYMTLFEMPTIEDIYPIEFCSEGVFFLQSMMFTLATMQKMLLETASWHDDMMCDNTKLVNLDVQDRLL